MSTERHAAASKGFCDETSSVVEIVHAGQTSPPSFRRTVPQKVACSVVGGIDQKVHTPRGLLSRVTYEKTHILWEMFQNIAGTWSQTGAQRFLLTHSEVSLPVTVSVGPR